MTAHASPVATLARMLRAVSLAQGARLWLGLTLFGLGVSLMVHAKLGVGPWDVFAQGVVQLLNVQIGTSIIFTGVLVVGVGWLLLRQPPGIATGANVIWIGVVANFVLGALTPWPALEWTFVSVVPRALELLAGIALLGFATALYLSAKLGAGPRDGLMLGLRARTGWSVRKTRTTIEVTVLAIGFALGGNAGPGTLVFALLIGPMIQLMMRLVSKIVQD
jgi:uncharacterized membrane protein YczE